MSHLNYASPIWSGADETHIKPLNSIYRRAAKLMCKQENISTNQKLQKLGLLTLNRQHDFNIAVAVFKTRHNMTPQYVSELLNPATERYGSNNYIVPRANMDLFKNSFSFSGPYTWNFLPAQIKTLSSLQTFKYATHRHFLEANS